MRVLRAIFANAGRIALDVARIALRRVERRREEQQIAGRRPEPSCSLTDCIAARARAGSPAPDNTAQLCAMASIRHSSSDAVPSGEPSSKYARRYHAPSHAVRSTAAAYALARAR